MKTKYLFAGLTFALTLGVLAPTSAKAEHRSSGSYVTRVVGRDHCGRPVYQKVRVPSHTSSHRSGHSHNSGRSSSGSGGGYIHAPGIDIHFGGSSSGHHGR